MFRNDTEEMYIQYHYHISYWSMQEQV